MKLLKVSAIILAILSSQISRAQSPQLPFELGAYELEVKSDKRCDQDIFLSLIAVDEDFVLVVSPTLSISHLKKKSVHEESSKGKCAYSFKTNITNAGVERTTEISRCPKNEMPRTIKESLTLKSKKLIYSYLSKISGGKDDPYQCIYNKK